MEYDRESEKESEDNKQCSSLAKLALESFLIDERSSFEKRNGYSKMTAVGDWRYGRMEHCI